MYRVLLVDDDQNVLNALWRELRNEYDIDTFTSPVGALHRCHEIQFDLVISDYQMSEMNGIQFLKKLREIQPDTARLLLSGQADIDALVSAINETHIYRFLAKPWDAVDLKTCIAQALAYRNIILADRRLAEFHRDKGSALARRKTTHPYLIVLVDGDKDSLTRIQHGLAQLSGNEGLYDAMRHEFSEAPSTNHGFQFAVDAFSSAVEALEYATHNDCDLVIAVQALPDMDGAQFLGEFMKIRPDAARILISDHPDKQMLSQAINEAQVHSFLRLSWNAYELNASASRLSWNIHELNTAIIQALISRDLLLENRRLAEAKTYPFF